MKARKASMFSAVIMSLAVAAPALSLGDQWQIDPAHSSAEFIIRHMVVSNVHGTLGKVSGTVHYDGKNLAHSDVDAVIDVSQINTNEAHRDAHLKSPDFFDVDKYPTVTFKSTKVEPTSDGFKIIGDLTMHGVTKPVTLTANSLAPSIKDGKGGIHTGTSASGKINRKDFGISWNKALDQGGTMLGDDVTMNLEVELIQKPEQEKASAN